jgi:hypothetical protein
MRISVAVSACLLVLVGCAGPHSTGALWAQQNLEQEAALFRLSDAQRADQAHGFGLGLADEGLRAERARLEAGLQACPDGAREPLTLSAADRVRDAIRVRAAGDSARLTMVAQMALADWRLRRARATGESRLCDLARAALAAPPPSSEPGQGLLERLGPAVVARSPRATAQVSGGDALVDLSLYASGWTDLVRAPSPLPQYLAAVYGGQLIERPSIANLNGQSAEDVVDSIAPNYPEWEPDAIYAALRAT